MLLVKSDYLIDFILLFAQIEQNMLVVRCRFLTLSGFVLITFLNIF
jgi:hypothetical protein